MNATLHRHIYTYTQMCTPFNKFPSLVLFCPLEEGFDFTRWWSFMCSVKGRSTERPTLSSSYSSMRMPRPWCWSWSFHTPNIAIRSTLSGSPSPLSVHIFFSILYIHFIAYNIDEKSRHMLQTHQVHYNNRPIIVWVSQQSLPIFVWSSDHCTLIAELVIFDVGG